MGKYLDNGEAFIVDHTPMATAPIRKPRWSPADAKIERLRKREREEALRKSRYSHAFTRVDEAMREGGEIPGAEPGDGGAELRGPKGARAIPPGPVLRQGQVCWFAHGASGLVIHGKVKGTSGTHALLSTPDGDYCVARGELVLGTHPDAKRKDGAKA